MKTSVAINQFDQPNLTAAPATPSCCCCCCCCLATLVSTSIIGASSASSAARMNGTGRSSAALLGAIAPIVGLAGAALGAWLSQDWPVALILAVAGMMVCWIAGFSAAGVRSDVAVPKSFKYLALFSAVFAIEFVAGAFLILMYVLPYLVIAPTIGILVVRFHLNNIPDQTEPAAGFPVPSESYFLPAPPTGEAPFSQPPGPLANQPLPGPPRQ